MEKIYLSVQSSLISNYRSWSFFYRIRIYKFKKTVDNSELYNW